MTGPIYIFRHMLVLLAIVFCAAQARADTLPVFVHLDLTGGKAVADELPSINAEVLVTLEKCGKFQLISEEQLGDNLLMGPAENLKFCEFDPACVAAMGATVNARWLLYGDIKRSFDGSKILVHLVLIDVPGEKKVKDKHGQFTPDGAALATGDMLRSMLGLKARKPKKTVALAEPPPSEAPKPQKIPKKAVISRPGPDVANSPWKDPIMWTAAATGLACLAAATTLGLLSEDSQDQAKALAAAADPLGAEGKIHDAQDMALGANILFGAGGAALTVAVVFLVLDLTDDTQAPAATPAVSCNSRGCSGWLSITF